MGKCKYKEGDFLGPSKTLFIKRLPNQYGIFKCSFCGKEFKTYIYNITRGSTRSCGCMSHQWTAKYVSESNKKRIENLIGQKFYNLTVIEKTDERQSGGVVWKCQCDCGNITYVRTADLKRGHIKSCGCLKESQGHKYAREWLQNKNIDFVEEHRFPDCKYKIPLSFDFYLPDYNICIEIDGVQHGKPIDYYGGEKEYHKRIIRDNIKNIYCEKNNIQLIRIPYDRRPEDVLYLLEKRLGETVNGG